MSKLTRTNAILPFTPAVDLTGKEGYAVSVNAQGKVDLHADDTVEPFGVIIHGTNTHEKTSVALFSGGLAGTVKLKLDDPVNQVGAFLRFTDDGVFSPDSIYTVVCAQVLETGVTGEHVEAVLFKPITVA
jgi:hypothetical protein